MDIFALRMIRFKVNFTFAVRLALCSFPLLFLAVGCATTGKGQSAATLESRLLQQHSFDDARFSAEPQAGLVPTGVWRVRGQRNVVYLAGTTHLVTTNQTPFPSSYYGAYLDSREIYVEMDTRGSALAMMGMMAKIKGWMQRNRAQFFYPPGKSLADEVTPATLDRLKEHFGNTKTYSMQPAFVIFMIAASSLGEQVEEVGGVEDVFTARARSDRKKIRELDDKSVTDVALLLLDEMVYEGQREVIKVGPDQAINNALDGSAEEFADASWRSGDLTVVGAEMDELRSDAPALYERMLPQRNKAWLPKILKALKEDKNVMILAGIAHFGGSEGLIELLKHEGFGMEQLYGVDPRR